LRARLARESILESAATAFARHGYAAATLQQIARDAGFTPASLYTYFPGKQAIFEALLDAILEEIYGTFAPRPEQRGMQFRERLHDLLTRQLSVAEQRRSAYTFLMRIAAGAEDLPLRNARQEQLASTEAYAEAMTAWFRQHATPGDIGQLEPGLAATVLWGIQHALFLRWLNGGDMGPLTDNVTLIIRFFFEGVRGSEAVPGHPPTTR